MKIWDEIKAHPYITTAIVVGGFGLIYAATHSGGGNVTAVAGGPSDAVQIAGIQAGAATTVAQSTANAQSATLDAETKVALATLSTQLSEQQLQASTATTLNSQNITGAITAQQNTTAAQTKNSATLYATQLVNNTISNPNASSGSTVPIVDALYTSVLGRAPDPAGLAYWTNQAAADEATGVTAQQETAKLLAAFQNSNENQSHLVAA